MDLGAVAEILDDRRCFFCCIRELLDFFGYHGDPLYIQWGKDMDETQRRSLSYCSLTYSSGMVS